MSLPLNTKEFPSTLDGFGYKFNKEGKLRKIDPETNDASAEPFEFNVSSDPTFNQKHYEALGEVITSYVYELMESKDVGLHKISVPEGVSPSTFVFASQDALSNPEKLMILIHGSGVVRAGQWARSLIINDSLDSGTQIPYIMRAKELGYAVLVLNTNDNHRNIDGKVTPIQGSNSPTEHCKWVWEHLVTSSKARKIAVVAHSYGGVCALELANLYFEEFHKKVFAIALTDSVHRAVQLNSNSEVHNYLQKVCCNWVSSSAPLDEHIKSLNKRDVACVSAGHPKHEMTSWSCISSLFKFIEAQEKL